MIVSVGNRHRGWARLGKHGYGVSWRPASDGYVFSERYGYAWAFRLGPWIIRLLKPFAFPS